MIGGLHALWFPFFILSFLFKSLETNPGMFGKAQALVEKYPVLFTLGLLISSILRGTTLAAHSRGGSAKLKKKKKRLVLLCITFCIVLQFFLTQNERKVKVFQSHCVETNLIPKLMLRADLINYFLDFQT